MMEKKYIGSIDQGTTSTRFILFDHEGNPMVSTQKEHKQIYPRPGWVEHDPLEIWKNTCEVIEETLKKGNILPESIASIGITNQRETAVFWNPDTGQPYGNAVVWQDTRTGKIVERLAKDGGPDRFRKKTGLPLATYFSGPVITWAMENNPEIKAAADKGKLLFGTIDSWLIWNLTGNHITDVTNASRTMLMDLKTLRWDGELLQAMNVPEPILPEIRASVANEPYGLTRKDGPFRAEIPVSGALGDQQAALFGQACFQPGESKNTYGTGSFLLLNTGEELIHSRQGLITTVAYRVQGQAAHYALEGSIAITGALVQWLRDNLGMIKSSVEIEGLARSVEDSGGVYFVPAFSGLYAPYWDSRARGAVIGLTRYVDKGHLARAVLEATAYQTREIFDAMQKDAGMTIPP